MLCLPADHYVVWCVNGRMWGINLSNQVTLPYKTLNYFHSCILINPIESDLSQGWNESFWRKIGLGNLVDEGYARIGTEIQEPGLPVGRGLEAGAAEELGLPIGTPVATAIIDAHAGGIGKGSSLAIVYLRM